MIIYDGPYNHQADAQSQLASFKLKFIKEFWERSPDIANKLSQQDYYAVNRGLTKAIEEMIDIISVQIEHEYENIKDLPDERMDIISVDSLAHQMAHHIIESDVIPVRKDKTMFGGMRYKCSVPVIKLSESSDIRQGKRL